MLSNCRNMASDNCMAINLIGEGDSIVVVDEVQFTSLLQVVAVCKENNI